MPFAVYVDTRSIQQFVYLSNELKDIIGASYLVEHLFDELIQLEECKSRGYEGGGNILMVFDDKKSALKSVTQLSLRAIERCPGLLCSAVVMDDFDESHFDESMTNLRSLLSKEKDTRLQITELPTYGITASCARTGLSAEYVIDGIKVSEVIQAKRMNIKRKITQDESIYSLESLSFRFAEKFDEMGQSRGNDSHIAVVHIDGNGIGSLMRNQKTLQGIQNLSECLKLAVQKASKQMVSNLVNMIPHCSHLNLSYEDEKTVLPLRPIICGGDDITFVCEGRLALDLTIDFISAFDKLIQDNELLREHKISCCAGIAIVKTKFPFYQAYTLAESLCRNAKSVRKHCIINDSMIDYHLLSGSQIGEIECIRQKGFVNQEGTLTTSKPYKVSELSLLMKNAEVLKSQWPTTRIMKLREVLYKSQVEQKEFIIQMKNRKETLPCSGFEDYKDSLYVNGKSIYADMVEIIDLIAYPSSKEIK